MHLHGRTGCEADVSDEVARTDTGQLVDRYLRLGDDGAFDQLYSDDAPGFERRLNARWGL